MDGKGKGKGECEKRRRNCWNLQKELKELMRISREYWEGFRIEKEYETRVYINKDGIRLFQSSTIEADSPAASAHPFLSITFYVKRAIDSFIYQKTKYITHSIWPSKTSNEVTFK
jgi:hypothetical protein